MARACRVVVLALLMFAVTGLASAAEKTSTPSGATAEEYEDDDYSLGDIGAAAANSPYGVVAAPLGGPVPPGAFDHAKGSVSTTSATAAASHIHFSAVAGVGAAALAAAFYF